MKKLVSVDFKKDQGVILRWNYADLNKRNKYFRHIIVLLTSSTEMAVAAIEGYVQHLKLGDLYTVVYGSRGVVRMKEWREKTYRMGEGVRGYFREEVGVSFSFEQASPIV